MIQKDSAGYSQLKGKNMYGKFKNNKLNTLDVIGTSEVIFFIRDEFQQLIGITKKQSSKNIFITLENNQIITIDFINMPDGRTYPPSEFEKLTEQEKILKGFIWRIDERPLTKEAIFSDPKIRPPTESLRKKTAEINEIED